MDAVSYSVGHRDFREWSLDTKTWGDFLGSHELALLANDADKIDVTKMTADSRRQQPGFKNLSAGERSYPLTFNCPFLTPFYMI